MKKPAKKGTNKSGMKPISARRNNNNTMAMVIDANKQKQPLNHNHVESYEGVQSDGLCVSIETSLPPDQSSGGDNDSGNPHNNVQGDISSGDVPVISETRACDLGIMHLNSPQSPRHNEGKQSPTRKSVPPTLSNGKTVGKRMFAHNSEHDLLCGDHCVASKTSTQFRWSAHTHGGGATDHNTSELTTDTPHESPHESNEPLTICSYDIAPLREDIGLLKDGLNDLRRELKDLKESSSRAQQEEACLYVRLQNYLPKHINKAVLETLLQSSIKSYIIISKSSPTVCKVRIASQHLHTALNAGLTIEGTTIRPWLPKSLSLKPQTLPMCGTTPTLAKSSTYGTLRITTWNARGLRSGEPYLCHLANTMSDVIVVTEHWLWPFEAHKLAKVNKEFHAETVTDSRLNESSSLNHGCGGVGILWKKSHDAVPISGIQSDRICGIRIQLSSTPLQCLTILGVYLPCADQGMQVYYCDHLVACYRGTAIRIGHGTR